MRAGLLVLMLAGCAVPVVVPGRVTVREDRAGQILAECKVLEAAHAATRARLGSAPPDILVGCPGHEGLRDGMSLAAQSAALRAANAAPLPPAVAASGVQGARIYRRMITRGVPETVAATVAQGPMWQAAVGR
ncbi:MAG: hypothetical protein Q8K20_15810 [Gemmobacter sp.]|jgi:hypothetical protein|nr:hypothetical protein [Gemmobacter sp.]